MSAPAQKPTSAEVSSSMASEIPRGFRALVRQTVKDFNLIRATKYGAGPLFVLFLVDWVQGFDSLIPTLFAPEIRKDFNVTITQIALIQQLFGSLFLFTGPLIGYLSDRFRRTRMVGLGALLSGMFSMFSGFAPNFLLYQFTRSLDKASETFGDIPSKSLSYDYYPVEARAKTVAVKETAGRLLGLISGPFAGFLAVALGWRTALRVFAIPVALSGLLILRLKDPVRGYWERIRAGEDEVGALEEPPPVKWGEALRILMGIKTLRRIFLILPVTTLAGSGFALIW